MDEWVALQKIQYNQYQKEMERQKQLAKDRKS